MEKIKFINPQDLEVNKLIASEQKHLFLSIRKKLSEITHLVQLTLRSKPKQIKNLLHFYQSFLVFKERLEMHFKQEQLVMSAMAKETIGAEPKSRSAYLTNRLFFLEESLKQMKNDLSGLINMLNDIILKFNNVKNEVDGTNKFFEELENLSLFLGVHKNLLKLLFTPKILQTNRENSYHLEAI